MDEPITEAMIEAGVNALTAWSDNTEEPEDGEENELVQLIYRAMRAARPQ